MQAETSWTVLIDLVWWNPVDHATTVSAEIWSRVKQGDASRVDSTCSRRRRQGCKCGCFNHGNVISSERDDRLGSLEVSAVTVMGNLRSAVRLRTSRTDRVGERGTPVVEGQVKVSVESSTGRVWTLTISLFKEMFQHLSQRLRNVWKLYGSFRKNAPLSALRNRRIDDFKFVEIFKMFERDGNSFISSDVLRHMKTAWGEKLTDEESGRDDPRGRHK